MKPITPPSIDSNIAATMIATSRPSASAVTSTV